MPLQLVFGSHRKFSVCFYSFFSFFFFCFSLFCRVFRSMNNKQTYIPTDRPTDRTTYQIKYATCCGRKRNNTWIIYKYISLAYMRRIRLSTSTKRRFEIHIIYIYIYRTATKNRETKTKRKTRHSPPRGDLLHSAGRRTHLQRCNIENDIEFICVWWRWLGCFQWGHTMRDKDRRLPPAFRWSFL